MSSVWTRARREDRLWPEERAHKKIDEALKKLRTYGRLILTQIILVVLFIALFNFLFSTGKDSDAIFAIPVVGALVGMALGVITFIALLFLLAIIINLFDIVAFLYRYDCGYIEDFSIEIRSLRNMSVACIICQFCFPPAMIITLFVLWRKYRRFKEYWTGDHGKVL